jgi:hypothetical protein
MRFIPVHGWRQQAFGGQYTASLRSITTVATWEDLLFGVLMDSFNINPNPGGASYALTRINSAGLYLITYTISWRNTGTTPVHCVARVVSGSGATFMELTGSFAATFLQGLAGAGAHMAHAFIANIANDNTDIKVQVGANAVGVLIDRSIAGAPAPTIDTIASIVVVSLEAVS